MEDPHHGFNDPWVRAHTPTGEHTPNPERKKRRSWFTGNTPVKAAAPSDNGAAKAIPEENAPTIQITHFTKKVMLSFDNVRIGTTRILHFRLENPHDFLQEVELEKFPFAKGFSVPDTVWEVEGKEAIEIPVAWNPTEEKNVRELVTFKCEGSFRLQLIILGTVKVPKKKNVNRRSTFTARKGKEIQARKGVAPTNPRRETFVQKRSPRSQPYPSSGKENKIPAIQKKVDSPRKARARSTGTVLEHILTPRQVSSQGQVERVILGGKVCAFSPQLTSKALMEITGQSPFADGKIQNEPQRQTLDVCEGMSPLLKTTTKQDLRKAALAMEAEAPPVRRLSKEQTSTVTKAKSLGFRLSEDKGGNPQQLFPEAEAELSRVLATPASSVFKPDEHSMCVKLTSTRIDDSVYPFTQDLGDSFHAEEEKSPTSIEDDSLEGDQAFKKSCISNKKESQENDILSADGLVNPTHEETGAEIQETTKNEHVIDACYSVQQDNTDKAEGESSLAVEAVSQEMPCDECAEAPCDAVEEESPESLLQGTDLPSLAEEQSAVEVSTSQVAQEPDKMAQSWRISIGGAEPSLTEAPKVEKLRPKQETSSWRVSLGSTKRSPTRKPVLKKQPSRAGPSRPANATSGKLPTSADPEEEFTIHKSAVTGRLIRKRLSDPIQNPNGTKKSRPSPEHKASSKATSRTEASAGKVSSTSRASSRQVNRTVALRKAAATGKQVPPKVPASSRPRSKPKATKTVKGVPMAKLQLLKPTHSALPRHPLPFAAKNIFYDERWMEKQEKAFTCWLNYVLTPDIDTPKDPNKNVKIDAHLLCLEGTSKAGPAPSKEDLSLRAYTARRRLNRLRRGACLLFQSEPVIRVMQKLEAEVEKGRIVVRGDKMLHADLGIKQELLNLILCYNPLWLRIGLETIYGELLPIQDNSDVYGISRFIVTRLLGNPDIAAAYAHPTVPNLFGQGYQGTLSQFTLKKFLMLVFFLDRSKLTRLIDHDPCLFCKQAQVKSSRDVLLEFSRRYLKGEGDITRHLSFLGYAVTHVQRPLDEFDFAVTKLAVDLRCGVRLSRVVELLTHNWTLSADLRVPAISRLQKIHNVELAFKTLKDRGIAVEGGGVNERAIVDGHREKTLELLWRIIFHYQVGVMLSEEQLREEIAFLTKNRKLRRELNALKTGGTQRPSSHPSLEGPHLYFKSPRLMLLMDWCKAVCSFYDIQIENFTVSFCDGRALCLLVHHYHPGLLPFQGIRQETTLLQFQREEEQDLNASDENFDGTWANTFSPTTGKETDHDKLLANERHNFRLLYEKVSELGGVPTTMVRSADMSNTIPDEKVVITYVSYLCARLLDLRQETRAARAIQLAWRAHQLRKERRTRVVKELAATKIQSVMRAFLLRRRQQRIGGAVLAIQTAARGYLARQIVRRLRERREIEKLSRAATVIQASAKGFLIRRRISQQRSAVTQLQAALRGHMTRVRLTKMKGAARTIQGWYRSQLEARVTREKFLSLRAAVIKAQALWRGIMARQLTKKYLSACKIQAAWKGYKQRNLYTKQRRSAVTIQSSFRKHLALVYYKRLRDAAVLMQVLYRAKMKGQAQRKQYVALREASVSLQKVFRGLQARREVHRIRSAVRIQAAFRCHQQRAHYLQLKQSVTKIQAAVRAHQAMHRYTQLRQAATVLQTRYRAVSLGRKVCGEYNVARGAAITIQAAVRCHQARSHFNKMRRDVVKVQALLRMQQAQRRYRQLRLAAIALQRRYRAILVGRKVCREYNFSRGAAITIQAAVRCHQTRQRYIRMRCKVVVVQAAVRGHLALKQYQQLQEAAIVLQTRYRAVLIGRTVCRDYHVTKGAVLTIQAAFRTSVARRQYLQKRSAAVKLQSWMRCHIARKNYIQLRQAAVVLQTRYRALCTARQVEEEYFFTRGAIITLQAAFRRFLQRKVYLKDRAAIVTLQATVRGFVVRRNYVKTRNAAIVLQRRFRALVAGRQGRIQYQITRGAIITLQAAFRCHTQRIAFLRLRSATIILQTALRKTLARSQYIKLRNASITLQTHFRAHILMKKLSNNFSAKRRATILLQSLYRGNVQRKSFLHQKTAAMTIQATFRGYLQHRDYTRLKKAVAVIQMHFRAWRIGQAQLEEYYLARGRVITIQALYRGYAVRKQLNLERAAATTIQAFYRCHAARTRYLLLQRAVRVLQTRLRAQLLANERSKEFQRKRQSVITLQAACRGYQQRKILFKQHEAATKIQAAYKGHVARSQYLRLHRATCVLQTRFRSCQLAKSVQTDYNIKRGAIITIQAACRGYLLRRNLEYQHAAATKVQAAFKGYCAHSQYLRLRQATCLLQSRFRSYQLAKAVQTEYNIKREAIITIQAACRGYQQRRILTKQHAAATKIQAAFKGHVAHTQYLMLHRATCVLQTRFRSCQLTKTVQTDYNIKRGAIITIQAAFRGHRQRRTLAKQHGAATKIQAAFKGHCAHSQYLRLRQATCLLQTRVRSYQLAKAVQTDYNIKRGAIITIQAACRGYLLRRNLKYQHAATTRIQAAFKGHVARSQYLRLRQATCLLQTRFRSCQLAKTVQTDYNIKRGAIITIQAAFRGHRQRRTLAKQHAAATKIQAAYKGHFAHSQYLRLCQATRVLQTRFRSSQLAKAVQTDYNIKRGAVRTIQAAFHGHKVRQALSKQRWAAVIIQAAVRSHQAHRQYHSLREATKTLQRRFRAHLLQKRVSREYNVMRGAAITLQSAYRGHLQRKALRQQHHAATKIQATCRGFVSRRSYLAIYHATQVLQTRYRASRLAYEVQREYHTKRGAAITLQATYRGHLQRKLLAQQHLAAVKIQAMYRCFNSRKRYLAVRQAALVVQTRFRAHQLSLAVQKEYYLKLGAVITLQAAFRGQSVRREFQKQQQSATKVQAFFRGYVQRVRYQRVRQAVIILQNQLRAYHLGQKVLKEYTLQRTSAVTIQAAFRCHRARKCFLAQKQAAIKIQAAVRGHQGFASAKETREERTGAALSFQRRWRANVLRDQQMRLYNVQRGAVITIQAAARTYLVQQGVKRWHRAATCIQSAYRGHVAAQCYKRTLQAIQIIQDHVRAHLLATHVRKEYLQLKGAAVNVQAVYRGLIVRRRVSREHAAATEIQASVRQFLARRHYRKMRHAAIVLQQGFRAKKSCQEQWLRYQVMRGACITLQAAVRGFLVREALKRSHRAATTIQSMYHCWKQQQQYKHTRDLIMKLQERVRAYLVGKRVQLEYDAMKCAAVTIQSTFRGRMARQLATQHRAARAIQSMYRMYTRRREYLLQRNSAVKLQAVFRMHLARKSYCRTALAVRTLQNYARGFFQMQKTRSNYLLMRTSAIVIQSHFRRARAQQSYGRYRQATVCIQSNYRRLVQQRRYRRIREAAIVLQRHYRATVLAQKVAAEYYLTRGAVITIQSMYRGYLQQRRYRDLRFYTVKLQARLRGTKARRQFAHMVRERKAAVCIQRHFRRYQTRKVLAAQRQARLAELQAFADRVRTHLCIIRLQRAYRNYRLRLLFKQRMDAILTVQDWMRAKLLRVRFLKAKGAATVLQRAARRYLARKNVAATRLQSVARVWLARRYVQRMRTSALKLQALWRGHRVRCRIKSKKVAQARARCRRANRNATEEKKLCNRAASALDYLLNYRSMSRILETLTNLEVVSRLSSICCERLVEGGAVPVLYKLIRSCNRSIPCMEIVQYIISILFNLAKNDSTHHAVLAGEEEAVATLLELLQIYRQKSALIFCKTCMILGKLLQDSAQAQIIRKSPSSLEKIASLHKLTSRKRVMDERFIKNKSLNASAFNTSSFAMGASFNQSAAGTPRKRRAIFAHSAKEWSIDEPMRAIDFLKTMAERV